VVGVAETGRSDRLRLVPRGLREANAFIGEHHRHSLPTVGHKFSVGAAVGEEIVGVAIAGRPVARERDDGHTVEVLRVCVLDEAPKNACSLLYGACCRAGRALGYGYAITYTLATERGSSLRAAGFTVIGRVPRKSWDTPSRRRRDRHRLCERICWGRAT
jgi:hypothetical protein